MFMLRTLIFQALVSVSEVGLALVGGCAGGPFASPYIDPTLESYRTVQVDGLNIFYREAGSIS
jgi:hypothetical protein